MSITVFYFSGTGNTWWCARKLQELFHAAGRDCTTVSIEQVDREEVRQLVRDSDTIGIGYPIYGSDLPETMKKFIESLIPEQKSDNKKLFVFCTQLLFSGDGAFVYQKELARKGWDIYWSAHFRMPNNICVTAMPFPYTTDRKKIDRRLRKTARKIEVFSQAVLSEQAVTTGASKCSYRLGLLQRGPYRRMFPKLRNDITIDADLCTRCGRCVAICPSGNLYEEGGGIHTRGSCILCVRCYNFCPVQAVLYMGKRHKSRRGVPYRGPVPEYRPELIARKN